VLFLDGAAIVDLNYEEDKAVTVDFNLVATEDGEFVEIQGAGEESTFTQSQIDDMLTRGRKGGIGFDPRAASGLGAHYGVAAGGLVDS
jgi:ribonuclease PH